MITEDLAKQNAGSKKQSRILQRSPVQPTAPPPLSRPSATPHEGALLQKRTEDLEVTRHSSLFWKGASKKSPEVQRRHLACQGPLIRINLKSLTYSFSPSFQGLESLNLLIVSHKVEMSGRAELRGSRLASLRLPLTL